MTLQGSQWEVVWPRGPVWDPDTQRKPQGKQPASTVVLGDNQESAQRCLPKTFYYSPTQNILGRNAGTNLDSLLKSRDLTLLTKFRLVKAMVFSSDHIWMWELDCEESWALKNWCFSLKNFYFYFILLYNTVLVLPYIDMNPPWVYMSSQTWTPFPPPTPYHLSGWNWRIDAFELWCWRRLLRVPWTPRSN